MDVNLDESNGSEILLSVLIPAFCYPEGVARILPALRALPDDHCEIVIFDDSPDNSVQDVVERWRGDYGTMLVYRRNRPALGAPENWNALLGTARGKYCWLLHHDEVPLGENFVGDLLHILRAQANPDVVVLDCVQIDPVSGCNYRHVPTWLRKLAATRFPEYLFRHNAIGAPSLLVVRSAIYPRFDVSLQWLVDVEAYVRLFRYAKRVAVYSQIRIGSVCGRADSISARLSNALPVIEKSERRYLRSRFPVADMWLRPPTDDSVSSRLLKACEDGFWTLICTWVDIVRCVIPYSVPRPVVRKAMLDTGRQSSC